MIALSIERDTRLERLECLDRKIQRLNRLHSRLSYRASGVSRILYDPGVSPQLVLRLKTTIERRHRRAEEAFQLAGALHQCWLEIHAGRAV